MNAILAIDASRLPTLKLFRMGFSTLEIAEAKNKPEAKIYNWLHQARETERKQIIQLRTGT